MEVFNIGGLEGQKVNILISSGLIPVNKANLEYMRKYYHDNVFDLIHFDIDAYIETIKSVNTVDDEIIGIVGWSDVSDTQKIALLDYTNASVSVVDREFGDELFAKILADNFDSNDMPWLLRNYNKQTDIGKREIRSLISREIDLVIQYAEEIDFNLLKVISADTSIGIREKAQLLAMKARAMNKKQLCEILILMGAEKIADNIGDGNKKIEITQNNRTILEELLSANVILEFEAAADGQHYKKIRYKKTKTDDNVPVELL